MDQESRIIALEKKVADLEKALQEKQKEVAESAATIKEFDKAFEAIVQLQTITVSKLREVIEVINSPKITHS